MEKDNKRLEALLTETSAELTAQTEALRASEMRLRAIIDTEPECVKIISRDGLLLEMNQAGLSMLEVDSLAQAQSRPLVEFVDPEYRGPFEKLHARVMNGDSGVLEFELIGNKGTRRWLETHAVPLRDAVGAVESLLAVTRDITERKREDKERTALLEKSQALTRALGEIIYEWRSKTNEVIWDGEYTRILGYSTEEIGDDIESWTSRLHPADADDARQEMEHAAREGRCYDLEYRFRRRDGAYVWLHDRGALTLDAAGNLERIVGVCLDITKRKRMEVALHESEERFRSTFEDAPAGIALVDPDGRFLRVNRALCSLLGYSNEELLARGIADVTPEEDLAITGDALRRVLTGESDSAAIEKRCLCKNQQVVWAFVRVVLLRGVNRQPLYFIAHIQDITARKQAEFDLRQTLFRQESVAQLSQLALATTDQQQLLDQVVRRTAESLDVELCKVLELLPDGDSLLLRAGVGWRQGLIGRATVSAGLHSQAGYTLASHGPVIVEDLRTETRFSGPPLLTDHGVISGMSVIIQDMDRPYGVLGVHTPQPRLFTKKDLDFLQAVANILAQAIRRKHAEDAVAEREQRLRRLGDNLPNGVIYQVARELDGRMRFLYVSAGVERVNGVSPQAVLADPMLLYNQLLDEDRQRVAAAEAESFNTMKVFTLDVRLRRADGEIRWFQMASTPRRLPDGRVAWDGIQMDITEHRQLEDRLRQALKMEAVGRLAGGVAHDFNNILTVIQGYTQLLMTWPDLDRELMEKLSEILAAGRRAANLTRQLLTFSRKQVLQMKAVDLNEIIGDLTKMLRRIIGEDIALQCSFAADLPRIEADVNMIEQILMNLSINARDAMPKGGQLTIATSVVTIDSAYTQLVPDARVGTCVRLNVSDTGCGMSPAIMEHLFEPFFTTKDVGKGTGLGLATVYGIVEQHHGWIEVASTENAGTTFNVYFLASSKARPKTEQDLKASMLREGGDETILLVEDEPAVRELGVVMLSQLGYRVIPAVSGMDALNVWRERAAEIDLVITDLVMPDGMTGVELVKQLSAQQPNLKILYISGYSAEVVAGDITVQEGVDFLQKPYDAQKLAYVVRQLLDAKGSSS